MSDPEKELRHDTDPKDVAKAGPLTLVPAMYLIVVLVLILVLGLWWWLT
jgi:hypothetical protein